MQRLFLALWTCALWMAAESAEAYCRLTTAEPSAAGTCSTEGRGLAWQRQCISYTVVPRELPGLSLEDIRDTIDLSFAQWADVTCDGEPLPLALGQTQELGACMRAEYNQFGPNANTIVFLSEWEGEDFPREAFGLTLVWHDPQTGEIFDADMQLNETIAPIAICSGSCGGSVVDLANVVTHEAGHFLGLGHSNNFDATMSANALLGETSKRSLDQDDRDGLCSIYGGEEQPSCEQTDYAPDRGFTPRCGGEDSDSSSCAACAVGARRQTPRPLSIAGFALALLWLLRRRR